MDTFEISTGSEQKPLQATHNDSKIFKIAERLGMDPNKLADHVRVTLTILPVAFYIFAIIISGLRLKLISQAGDSTAPLSTTLLETIQYINQQGWIYDIYTIKGDGKCKSGYELGEVGQWLGSQGGCLKFGKGSFAFQKDCNEADTRISATPKMNLYNWKNTRFCVKRIPRNDVKYRMTKTCGNGMTECAGRYCIPDKFKCPISWIKTEAKNFWDPYKAQKDPDSQLVYSIEDWVPGKNLNFIYSKNIEYVLNGFEITYAKRDCWDMNDIDGSKEANNGKERTVYPLLNAQPRNDKCGGYSFRSDLIEIDSMDEYEFYRQNKEAIPIDRLTRLSSYSAGQKVYLQARFAPYTMPTDGCWDIDFGTVGSAKSRLEWFKHYSWFFYYIGGALSFTISLFLIYNVVKAVQYGKRVVYYAGVYLANMYFSMLLLGYFLFESLVIFGYRLWLISASNYLRQVDGCFLDRNIRNMMRDMEKYIDQEYLHKFLDDTAILMGICLIIGTVVVFCFVVLSKLRHYSIQGM